MRRGCLTIEAVRLGSSPSSVTLRSPRKARASKGDRPVAVPVILRGSPCGRAPQDDGLSFALAFVGSRECATQTQCAGTCASRITLPQVFVSCAINAFVDATVPPTGDRLSF